MTFAACIAALAGALASMETPGYHWPLDLPRVITSSFGEYRPGRFHAGIDLRTSGIGRAVRAPVPGYVSRVRCAPSGYGKAVYLQLDDGKTAVFAHLDDFMPALRAHVQAEQHARKSYTVDLYPAPGQFRVNAGDVVAWSGDTGTGAPHLHYEVRDPANRVLNPRALGMSWPDDTPPVIRRVALVPATPESRLDAGFAPIVLDAAHKGGGAYETRPVAVSGRFGLALDVIDPANNGASILGVYQATAALDGEEVFRIQRDRLSYDTMHHGAVAWHPFLREAGRFLVLWRWPGNECETYGHSEGAGWITAPDASGTIEAAAEDFFGNTARLTVPLVPPKESSGDVDAGETSGAAGSGGSGAGRVEAHCWGEWIAFIATFPGTEAEAPVLTVHGEAGLPPRARVFDQAGPGSYHAAFHPVRSVERARIEVSHPRLQPYERTIAACLRGEAAALQFDDVRVRVEPRSPYGTLFLAVESADQAAALPGLPPPPGKALGKVYHFWPGESPIDAPVRITFPRPGGAERVERMHVYRAGSSGWSRQGTRHAPGELEINTRTFGTFLVIEDDRPPAISDFSFSDGASAASRRPTISAAVSDRGSGIADITVTANGEWLLMRHDPPRNRVVWEADRDLPAGRVELRFELTDHAGNQTVRTRTLTTPE